MALDDPKTFAWLSAVDFSEEQNPRGSFFRKNILKMKYKDF